MAAFTPNTGGTVNWDTLSGGSTNATLDTYTISNGTTLLIDTDSYQCANHSTAFGSLDTVSFTGTGGILKIDGTNVRVIPYNTGTGNVPAIGTTITQGAVTAVLLGVWATWLVEPTTAGSAMPATGYIKVKNKTGGNFTSGALTGIGASATGADVVGWIEVRGADTATITVPRIGKFQVTGDWFELGTTNGTRGQIISCPTCATTAGTLPGVWIETSAGSGVYERYVGVGSMAALSTNPTDERGKMVWHTTTGFRIGSDGTNNVGYLPATGCKVRVPNVFLHCCTRAAGSGSGPRVSPSTTNTIASSTRQEFVTTSAGEIDIQYANSMWCNYWLQPYKVTLKNSGFNDYIQIAEDASPLDIDNCIVSPNLTAIVYAAFALTSCFSGGTVQNSNFASFSLAASGRYVNNLQYITGVTFNNIRTLSLLNRGNANTGTWTVTQAKDCTFTNCYNIGARYYGVSNNNCTFTNSIYNDAFSGTTGTTNSNYAIDCITGSNGVTVDGISFNDITNVQPYAGLVNYTASYNLLIKNIGTYASPLSLGSTNAAAVILNSGGNNDTITLKRIYVSNTRTGLWALVNSDTKVVAEHVYGDYADTTVVPALNAKCKSCGLTGATTGQTSVYGTHWSTRFTSTTAGFLEVFCNEPSALSTSQCYITTGTPQFNSAGQVALTILNQQVVWETDWWVIGYTAFTNTAPTLTGTNTGNLTVEYALNTGAGYGSWKTLSAANLSAETVSATTGFKIKIRATCATANSGNLLTNIRVAMTTTSSDQSSSLYPLSTTSLTLTGLISGSDIVILDAGTSTERVNVDANSGTSYTYEFSTGGNVDICMYKQGYIPYSLRNYTLPTSSSSLPVQQVADRNFYNPV